MSKLSSAKLNLARINNGSIALELASDASIELAEVLVEQFALGWTSR